MLIALIPVKELALAKTRLAPVLGDAERERLARAMYRDVLAAAQACASFDGVAVTSRDGEVLALAEDAGALALPEPGGLNEALTSSSAKLARRGAARLVVVAADLPLAQPEQLSEVAASEVDVTVVSSRDGGTNALALPLGRLEFRFGPDSARRHLAAAREAGLDATRLKSAALALDVDTPEDLARLRAVLEASPDAGRHTVEVLESVCWPEAAVGKS